MKLKCDELVSQVVCEVRREARNEFWYPRLSHQNIGAFEIRFRPFSDDAEKWVQEFLGSKKQPQYTYNAPVLNEGSLDNPESFSNEIKIWTEFEEGGIDWCDITIMVAFGDEDTSCRCVEAGISRIEKLFDEENAKNSGPDRQDYYYHN